jgi:type I restriction enzyme, S subunit
LNNSFPLVPLGEILTKSRELIEIDPHHQYKQVTIKLWGQGVVLRDEVAGSSIAGAKRFVVRPQQFILSRIDARNGAFGLVPDFLNGAVVSNDFPAFTPDSSRLLPDFLGWMSKTRGFVDLCRAASEGTTNRVRLKESLFMATKIPLPPLAEQRRIVAQIEELAAKIEEARRLRQQAGGEAEALVVASRANVFEASMEAKTAPLASMVKLERGKFSHRPRNEPRFFGGEHPWIQIAEIESSNKFVRDWTQTLNDSGLAISRKFPRGTLLVSIAATIGAVGILDFDCCVPDSIVAATPRPNVDGEYVYHYFGYLRSHLEEVAPQSAQKKINLKILSSLPFPTLPILEQRRVVAYLDDLQAKVDSLKQLQAETATELDALLPSVLDRAIKGRL